MPKPNLKIYLLISLSIILLVILALSLIFKNQKKEDTIAPSPTIEPLPDQFPSAYVTPEIILPTGFTGVLDEELPAEIKNESVQIQDLSNKVPLSQPLFNIDFNWDEYKFIITLKEPKDQTRSSFEEWLKQNYPAIPLDEFIIN